MSVMRLFLLAAGVFVSSSAFAKRAVPSVVLRGNLDRCGETFRSTGRGTVAFIGGSITEMNGYRPMVMKDLQERFPDTEFTFINAGISSTCSHTASFRLGRDVLSKKPDLLFVEFAVNDDQDAAHSLTEAVRGMEGVIRGARMRRPEMDVVVTHFVNPSMLETVQQGEVPLSIRAHEKVCRHYGVSTCNVAFELAKRIADGTMTWKQYGGTHPKPPGNRVAADLIGRLLDQAWSDQREQSESVSLPDPVDPASYFRGRFLDPEQVHLGEDWRRSEPDWKALPGSLRSRFAGVTMVHSSDAGSELNVTFTGSAIGLYVLAGPDAGVVEYSIDGGVAKRVDLYHRFSKGLHYPRTVVLASGLEDEEHTVTIRVADESNEASKGHAVRVLEFTAS